MSATLFLIFNHQLTARQRADAHASLAVERFVSLPDHLQQLWRQIPPDMPQINGHLAPLREWLGDNAKAGDYLLIQGDFGACCLMVSFSFEQGLVPIYSTTRREAQEKVQPDGSVITLTHNIEHQIFRLYGA
jgi:hypothetical protein